MPCGLHGSEGHGEHLCMNCTKFDAIRVPCVDAEKCLLAKKCEFEAIWAVQE